MKKKIKTDNLTKIGKVHVLPSTRIINIKVLLYFIFYFLLAKHMFWAIIILSVQARREAWYHLASLKLANNYHNFCFIFFSSLWKEKHFLQCQFRRSCGPFSRYHFIQKNNKTFWLIWLIWKLSFANTSLPFSSDVG